MALSRRERDTSLLSARLARALGRMSHFSEAINWFNSASHQALIALIASTPDGAARTFSNAVGHRTRGRAAHERCARSGAGCRSLGRRTLLRALPRARPEARGAT